MSDETPPSRAPTDVDLDLSGFLRGVIGGLAATLHGVVGIQEAEGFVSVVGHHVGTEIDAAYRAASTMDAFDIPTLADILVDLKKRVDGDFYIDALFDDRIVLRNRRCPFGDAVVGRPALCMMTSAVFGRICSNHVGFAHVALEETIARGDDGCRVVVSFRRGEDHGKGRAYYGPPKEVR